MTLPASLIAVAVYLYLQSMATLAAVGTSLLAIALLAPILAIVSAVLVVVRGRRVKWTVIGTYRPRVEPLWSRFVRRSELVTGLYEAAAVPALLYLLMGTPMLPPMLRLFGAKIGRRTWIGTTYMTEFDLVEIGDDAMVGRHVSLQTHLFEDRVMKMSTVRIGEGATVGDRGHRAVRRHDRRRRGLGVAVARDEGRATADGHALARHPGGGGRVTRRLALVYRGPAARPAACSDAVAALLASSPVGFDVRYVGPDGDMPLTADVLATASLYAQPGGGELARRTGRCGGTERPSGSTSPVAAATSVSVSAGTCPAPLRGSG